MQKPIRIFIKLRLCGLIALSAWLFGTTAWGLEIVFRPEVAVSAEMILLKDIVFFKPADDRAADRLGSLAISAAPAPGERLNLSRQFLQYRIGPAVQAAGPQMVWPENVVVKRTAQSVSAEQFAEIFKGYVRKNAPWKTSEIFFARINTPGTIVLPQGRLAIEIREKTGRVFLGNVFLLAQVNVNGKTVRTVSLSGEVSVEKEVVRAARKIERGAVLGMDDLSLVVEKIRDLRPESNLRPEDIVGKRATRSIQAGQLLENRMFQNIPMVQKGKRVLIRADNGVIQVTAVGVVQENGQQGDQVKVINTGSGKEITATVAGPGTVLVSF